MSKESKLPAALLAHMPWENNETPIWPSSTFVMQRNLKDKLFPSQLEDSELVEIKEMIKPILLKSSLLKNPTFLNANELSQSDREFLYEHFTTLSEVKELGPGQGFCLDETHSILISINFTDHICIHIIDTDSQWDASFSRLTELDKELAKHLHFAYSDQFGFLTADPGQCGTGLVIEPLLHLPLLLSEKKPVDIMHHVEDGIMLSSLSRNLNFTGDLGMIQNIHTLGISEDQILHLLHTNALTLMNLEKKLQTKMADKPTAEVKDKVARALGLLKSSFQMDTKEALSALSMVKLGHQLGWIEGISLQQIHSLFFRVQRAHLSHGDEKGSELMEHRAQFLKGALEQVKTTIS